MRAFIEGADAAERQYPYSRPANDFTDWTAFLPREEVLNWAVSYPGCGSKNIEIGCTFFTNTNNEAGVVLHTLGGQEIKSVSLQLFVDFLQSRVQRHAVEKCV